MHMHTLRPVDSGMPELKLGLNDKALFEAQAGRAGGAGGGGATAKKSVDLEVGAAGGC